MQWEPIKFLRIAGAPATLWRAVKPFDGNPYVYAATHDLAPVAETDNWMRIEPRDYCAVLSQRAALDNLRHASIPATRQAAAALLSSERENRSGGRNGGRPAKPTACGKCGRMHASAVAARGCDHEKV